MRNLFTLALGAALPALSHAFAFDDIQFWVGAGAHRAAFVVDFRDGQAPASYAWGFRWDGAATGKEMLAAIDAADAAYQADVVKSAFGEFVDAMRYLPSGSGWTHHGDPWPAGYFSYWTRGAGEADWAYAQAGMSDRILEDGSWDGWAWVPNEPGTDALPPATPIAAVPEPATLATLAAGALAIAGRRRKATR